MKKGIRVRQRDETDCGPACLSSVAAYFGHHVPVAQLRLASGTTDQGTTMAGLVQAAGRIGLIARAVRGEPEHLRQLPLPVIAHVNLVGGGQHFVVITGLRRDRLRVMDPATGKIVREPLSAFALRWTGILLVLSPSDRFEPVNRKLPVLVRFWDIARPHRGLLAQAFLGALVSTLLGLTTSLFVEKLFDGIIPQGNWPLLAWSGTVMGVFLLSQCLTDYHRSLILIQTGQRIDARLSFGYYQHLLRLPQSFFDSLRVGEIISRLSDAIRVRNFVNEVALHWVVNALIVVFSYLLLFFYSWKLGVMMLMFVPAFGGLLALGFRLQRKWQRTLMEKSAVLETQWVESLTNIGTVRRLGLEQFASMRTAERYFPFLESGYRAAIAILRVNSAADLLIRVAGLGLLICGGAMVIGKQLSPGMLLAAYSLTAYMTGPLFGLLGSGKPMQEAIIAADRLFEITDLETRSGLDNLVPAESLTHHGIEFLAVDFQYGALPPLFRGLSFTIAPGGMVAIAGESGSGKSTVAALLQGIYAPTNGGITIGGISPGLIGEGALSRMIAIVPQHCEMFSGSIASNIAIGEAMPDMKRILDLGQRLGLHGFVSGLPHAYDTELGEQGKNLSGGQKQKLALARALYRDPDILILDEASAALDPISEAQMLKAVRGFGKTGKTILVIAHRIRTIRHCDRVLFLENGRIAEEGEYGFLLSANGRFARFVDERSKES